MTTVPQHVPSTTEVPRSRSTRGRTDVVVLLGGGAAALSLAALLVTRVLPGATPLAFLVIAYLLFLALYGVLVWTL